MALSFLIQQTLPVLSHPSVFPNVFLLAQSTTESPIDGKFEEKSFLHDSDLFSSTNSANVLSN